MRPPQPSSLHVLDAHPQAPRGRHRGAGAGVEALTWGVAGDGEREALGRGGLGDWSQGGPRDTRAGRWRPVAGVARRTLILPLWEGWASSSAGLHRLRSCLKGRHVGRCCLRPGPAAQAVRGRGSEGRLHCGCAHRPAALLPFFPFLVQSVRSIAQAP